MSAGEESTTTRDSSNNVITSSQSHEVLSQKRVLLAASGSVATIKLVQITRELSVERNFAVKVVLTHSATHFVNKDDLLLAGAQQVLVDQDEWTSWAKIGDPVLHIELRKWADLIVVAPLSANTLAKFANGLSDNLLTCVARAWDLQKPFLVAPAMNTHMFTHPFTSKHIATLQELGIKVIPPIAKVLACGDTGVGAMASVSDIVSCVTDNLSGTRL